MTTYTPIADSEIDVDSPCTESLMTRMRNNPIAISEGSSGAPKLQTAAYQAGSVDQAAIGNAAVGQGELKTATASGSTTILGGGTSVSLTGGSHSWWTAGGSGTGNGVLGFSHTDTAAGVIGLGPAGGTSQTFYRDERYIQASPPYDMGDGEVPLFIFALIDNASGKIDCLEVGQEPTWAYHGPTIITPQHIERLPNKKYKKHYEYKKRMRYIFERGAIPQKNKNPFE